MTRHQDACRKKRKPEGGQQLLSFAPEMPSTQKLKIHALLQRWIVRDQQSLSVVAHPDFRAFLSAAAGGYDPPSRYVLTNKIRNDYEDIKVVIKGYMRSLPGKVALTTDGWTAANGDQFLSLTAHCIGKDWTIGSLLLDFPPFPVPHTAENGANLITRALLEFGIDKKITACVTDNTPSAFNITTILKQRFRPSSMLPGRCAAHLINLVVKHGLNDADRDVIFAPCRSFVNLIQGSKPTKNALREACKVRGITFKMLSTVMDTGSMPVWLGVNLCGMQIQDLTKILEVFSDVSEHIQGRKYPTISAAAQGYVLISTELDALGTSPSPTAWGIEVVKLFQNRLVSYREHLIDAPLVQWATLLDPSMKTKVIECDGVHLVGDVVGSLMEHLVAFYPENSPTSSTFVPSADAATSSFQQRWEKMDSAPTISHLLNPRKQLHIYLQEPAIKSNVASDSLRYWAVNEGQFPSLSAMARDLLVIQATSVPSEATFSRGGEVITKRRNRLIGTTVTAIMCLDSWMEGGFDSIRAFDLEDIVEPIEVEE
ncbi:unnamed protein product [Tilletia controversa]|uniref:HAT C-terminal dimerisation domain-containing protein n=1 Tax=Tilletia controversa TaxID=13291 RepID=A0A8X7SV20_9BASI|nr:hypothetical protein A4X06_0g6678 [Tilletia controversa]CAD6930732.1 unnamed protein product [Tilletia controversa]